MRLDFLPIGAGEERSRRREEADHSSPKAKVQRPKSKETNSQATQNALGAPGLGRGGTAQSAAAAPSIHIGPATSPTLANASKSIANLRRPPTKPRSSHWKRNCVIASVQFQSHSTSVPISEFRILAAEKNIAAIEVKEDRLMLTRNNDFVMIGSKFPRLTKNTAPPASARSRSCCWPYECNDLNYVATPSNSVTV